jgi:prepilin-type N-terminal cleavage/methylation domain-containing protein
MQTQRTNAGFRVGRTPRRGFTLAELMVTLIVVGIMAAMSMPSFQRAVRQSRADVAAANLRAIWAAERLYWLEYHAYTDKLTPQTSPSLPGLVDLGLLDPALFDDGNYSYEITPPPTADNFTATATSHNGDITITMNETGIVTATGISLGFQ